MLAQGERRGKRPHPRRPGSKLERVTTGPPCLPAQDRERGLPWLGCFSAVRRPLPTMGLLGGCGTSHSLGAGRAGGLGAAPAPGAWLRSGVLLGAADEGQAGLGAPAWQLAEALPPSSVEQLPWGPRLGCPRVGEACVPCEGVGAGSHPGHAAPLPGTGPTAWKAGLLGQGHWPSW